MTLGDWWAVLRRHRFAIDSQYSPRTLVQTAYSVSNSINARIERGQSMSSTNLITQERCRLRRG
jgi:hypothetical protein